MGRPKNSGKAIQRATTRYQKAEAARFGTLAAGKVALVMADKLKQLARLQLCKVHDPELFKVRGGLAEVARLGDEIDRAARSLWRGCIRPDFERGTVVYDASALEQMAKVVRAQAACVQPLHEVLAYIHDEGSADPDNPRVANTVAETAKKAATLLRREYTYNFREQVRDALDDLGLPYAKGRPGPPPRS